jgi:DNA (cytosine-5)-methyltransferase 1
VQSILGESEIDMRHASLFSGIGGFDLAAEWMGWENVMQCEIDPFCQKVLRHYFPSAHLYGDIRKINGTEWRNKIDILTGGFPCQPFSAAGRRRGTDDNRFLWPEMLRIIREIQPTWVVAENVRGLASIDSGLVFERVCSELEANGYEVQPFCIPACAVGAPHRRERLWFIGYAKHHGLDGSEDGKGGIEGGHSDTARTNEVCEPTRPALSRAASDRPSIERERGECCGEPQEETGNRDSDASNPECNLHQREKRGINEEENRMESVNSKEKHSTGQSCGADSNGRSTGHAQWEEGWLQAATRLCRVDDGLPRELDGITIPKWRRESLKAYGNAIVPQVAYQIFKAISLV